MRTLRNAFAILAVAAGWSALAKANFAENLAPHAAVDRSGEIATQNGLSLHFAADLGSVTIETLPPMAAPVVRYKVHVETDAREPVAQALLEKYTLGIHNTPTGVTLTGGLPSSHIASAHNAQFWVQFVISVPANYNLNVTTGGGDIETADIGGHVFLNTEGGNIKTGRLGALARGTGTADTPLAKVVTQGGHITVEDVYGDLDAFTAGGHIQAGNINGSAKLRTGGGHIRAGRIKGAARLETDGGNITVGEAGAALGVRTGGGQIDLGEVHGSIHAQTAGGGIRAMYIAGPMEMQTNGGSICLTRVANTVRAETGGGTITAWITPDARDVNHVVQLPGPSQLGSSTGDIVVFLPRNIAATIDATVENGGPTRIESDPSLQLNVQAQADGLVHALGVLNGGGALLKLRTTAGKIRLQYVDAEMGLRQSLQQEQMERLSWKLNDAGVERMKMAPDNPMQNAHVGGGTATEEKRDWLDAMMDRLEAAVTGGVHEDSDEFRKRIVNCCKAPEYPVLAKRAGLQGIVRLQVRVKGDGSVNVDKVLEGQPTLVDAATVAVRQWRANPEEIGGRKVDVISTVTFNFTLH
ncbi:MAG TPA: energy transducer TonB [Candidatus Acidoferrum sp.]